MNILDIQDKLKGLSQNQLTQEMQSPSGSVPQFLVLSEINRRQAMRQSMQQQGAGSQTVAQELLNGAGVPSEGMSDMGRSMAPKSSIAQNTGIGSLPQEAPPPDQSSGIADLASTGMYAGGLVTKMATGAFVPRALAMPQRSGPTPLDVFNMQEERRKAAEENNSYPTDVAADQNPQPVQNTATAGVSGQTPSSGKMSTYEQMLADAMSNAEKKAKQDKWLALAQAGMSLMSSTQPNLAGALGEAGAAGISALQNARDTAEATKLQLAKEQFAIDQNKASLARAASAKSSKSGNQSAKDIVSQLDDIQKLIDSMNPTDPLTGESKELSDAERATLAQAMAYRDALIQSLGQTGLGAADLSDLVQ